MFYLKNIVYYIIKYTLSNIFIIGKKVGRYTIIEAKCYAQMNGYGAPKLEKPIIHKKRFESEQLAQFDKFLQIKLM